jgi:hypothetical protein
MVAPSLKVIGFLILFLRPSLRGLPVSVEHPVPDFHRELAIATQKPRPPLRGRGF